MQEITRKTIELEELDKELQDAIAWHAAEIALIMGTNEGEEDDVVKEREIPSPYQHTDCKTIDMANAYPSIGMLLCNRCLDTAENFCVIACRVKQQGNDAITEAITATTTTSTMATAMTDWSFPPTPPLSTNGHLDIDGWVPGLDSDPDTMHTKLNRELTETDLENDDRRKLIESVEQEMETVTRRHAEEFLETMAARSRLVCDLLTCQGCEVRASGRTGLLTCGHVFLCVACIELLEFYLVPQASSRSS